ncbi:metallo-beta-lactamase [Arthroderma uncinatum]|uniref:metallo-beta-lactamase n=1 Tax=Arthroderma uncinatum TaxID=74035 RepID=UPI00144AAC3D|nr:metallo-beta-lactamase [Arthroderma uncinatum]KAF3483852.1 metallo-beta-lactamase [Arthroderma uncinatum]
MDLSICGTCGVQYDTTSVKSCKICDDPRQYVPTHGQRWTTLRSLLESRKYRNGFKTNEKHPGLVSIFTVPEVAIGQRAFLCCTPKGNILWDCITYLDEKTVRRVNELGGIRAIAISHPHFYSTAIHWAEAFQCPVYYSAEDEEWIQRFFDHGPERVVAGSEPLNHSGPKQILWEGSELNLLDGQIKILKTGGHFPGSSVLYWKDTKRLLVADTIQVVPSGVYHVDRPKGTASYTFMWSYPNQVRSILPSLPISGILGLYFINGG